MLVPVKFAISRWIFNSKIRAQIDDPQAGLQKRPGKFHRDAVRQGEEGNFGGFSQFLRARLAESQRFRDCVRRGPRKNFGQRFARILPGSDRGQLRVWMTQKQPH